MCWSERKWVFSALSAAHDIDAQNKGKEDLSRTLNNNSSHVWSVAVYTHKLQRLHTVRNMTMTRTSSTPNYPDCFDWIPLLVYANLDPWKTSYSNRIDRMCCRYPLFDLLVLENCEWNSVRMPVWLGLFWCLFSQQILVDAIELNHSRCEIFFCPIFASIFLVDSTQKFVNSFSTCWNDWYTLEHDV